MSRCESYWQHCIAVTCRLTRVLCRSMLRGLCSSKMPPYIRAIFPDFIRYGSLPPSTSIFTAELWAILIAIRSLFTLDVVGFVIFTYSRAALSPLEDFNNAHPIVSEIFNWLVLAARREHRISFCWVPAHVSVKGNEETYELAKTGVSHQFTACPVPHRELFLIIRSAVNVVWQERWNANRATSKMGAITARAVSLWSYAHVRGRCREITLACLWTGHTHLTHGFLMSREVEPYCDDCLVPLTVRHLLVECPSLRELLSVEAEMGVFLSLWRWGRRRSPRGMKC